MITFFFNQLCHMTLYLLLCSALYPFLKHIFCVQCSVVWQYVTNSLSEGTYGNHYNRQPLLYLPLYGYHWTYSWNCYLITGQLCSIWPFSLYLWQLAFLYSYEQNVFLVEMNKDLIIKPKASMTKLVIEVYFLPLALSLMKTNHHCSLLHVMTVNQTC